MFLASPASNIRPFSKSHLTSVNFDLDPSHLFEHYILETNGTHSRHADATV